MLDYVNKCFFCGVLGKDPEQKTSKNGKLFCNFSIAVKGGQPGFEKTEWINCVAFGKQATAICFAQKGDCVMIAGRMQTDKYEKDGVQKQFTKIIIDHVYPFRSKNNEEKLDDMDCEIPF